MTARNTASGTLALTRGSASPTLCQKLRVASLAHWYAPFSAPQTKKVQPTP